MFLKRYTPNFTTNKSKLHSKYNEGIKKQNPKTLT